MQDELRSEGFQILTIVVGFVFITFVQFATWAAFSDQILADALGGPAIVFWAAQVGLVISFFFFSLVGFTPETKIDVNLQAIRATSKDREIFIDLTDKYSVEVIDSDHYQKHYRKYAATTLIGAVTDSTVALIWSTGHPFVFGLPEYDLKRFIAVVEKNQSAHHQMKSSAEHDSTIRRTEPVPVS